MVMFLSMLMLLLLLLLISFLLVLNFGVYIFSLKVFNNYFFGDWELSFNVWSVLFMFMVLMISMSVMIFSFSYMEGLKVSNFVFLYLSFVVSMVWLILNNNFYWMMFGWDGLGVVSFLLIVFYMNVESVNNGLFTMFQNRIGDLFFVLFIVGMLSLVMWTNLILIFGMGFLIVGSTVKSAQFPFNAWLLSAMSAPTPISSLVHSSTLVVAGVYILLQYSYCLMQFMMLLKWMAVLTLLISFYGLLNEADMKKLIAYSTMSHVALMMYLFSFQLFKVVYFHLNIHAMFKSLMFMCFGFVMLSSFHSQDKRLVSINSLNPLVKIIYGFSSLCLMGLPFLSAFFSKDLIIENMMLNIQDFFSVFLLMCFLGVSAYYGLKLMKNFSSFFSYQVLSLSKFTVLSVLVMLIISISMINIYLSLVVSISLQVVSFKMMVYLFIIFFFILSWGSNLNYKLLIYDKMKNFSETFKINYYFIDQFFFWSVSVMLSVVNQLSFLKFFLLVNWWFLLMVVLIV